MAATRSPIAAEIRTTIAVAAPLAAANLAQMAMQVTNAVMVGHLGAVALAAAGRGAGGGLIVAAALAVPMMMIPIVLPPLLSGLGFEPDLVAEIRQFLWAI